MDGYALLLGFGKYLAFCCKKLGQRSDIADIERFWAKGVKSHSVGCLPGLESGAPCSKWPSLHPHR